MCRVKVKRAGCLQTYSDRGYIVIMEKRNYCLMSGSIRILENKMDFLYYIGFYRDDGK